MMLTEIDGRKCKSINKNQQPLTLNGNKKWNIAKRPSSLAYQYLRSSGSLHIIHADCNWTPTYRKFSAHKPDSSIHPDGCYISWRTMAHNRTLFPRDPISPGPHVDGYHHSRESNINIDEETEPQWKLWCAYNWMSWFSPPSKYSRKFLLWISEFHWIWVDKGSFRYQEAFLGVEGSLCASKKSISFSTRNTSRLPSAPRVHSVWPDNHPIIIEGGREGLAHPVMTKLYCKAF